MKKGFTLLEILVVVAVIGILASVVLAALQNARLKGADAAIKADLKNASTQIELFYHTNTVNPYSYTGVCSDPTMVVIMNGVVKAAGVAFAYNPSSNTGSTTTVTCTENAVSWAIEAPLKSVPGNMWCIDSTGKIAQRTISFRGNHDCTSTFSAP